MINETKVKVRIIKAWGNTGENSFKSKVFLPMKWLKDMGISKDYKLVYAFFDKNKNTIELKKYKEIERKLNREIERKITITFSVRGTTDTSYKAILGIPIKWVNEMNLQDREDLYLVYENNTIVIKRYKSDSDISQKYSKKEMEEKIKEYKLKNINFSIMSLLDFYKNDKKFVHSYKNLYKALEVKNSSEFKEKYFS